jgi:hypothetical protein
MWDTWGKSEGKRPLARPRRRREKANKMSFKEAGWKSMEWNSSGSGRYKWRALFNTIVNLLVP